MPFNIFIQRKFNFHKSICFFLINWLSIVVHNSTKAKYNRWLEVGAIIFPLIEFGKISASNTFDLILFVNYSGITFACLKFSQFHWRGKVLLVHLVNDQCYITWQQWSHIVKNHPENCWVFHAISNNHPTLA